MNLGGSVKLNKCGMFILLIIVLIIFYYFSQNDDGGGGSGSGSGGISGNGGSHHNSEHYSFFKNPNEINLRKLLIGSIIAAQRGGLEILTISGGNQDVHAKSKGKTLEGANDPVTDADLLSHCVMKHGLHRIFPKLRIISEEDGSASKKNCPDVNLFDLDPTVLYDKAIVPDENVNIDDVTVWIDPLDATQEYTEKLYQYVTTMVCVAVKGSPTIGVIHNPFTGKTTWAWVGKTTSEDLLKIKHDNDGGDGGLASANDGDHVNNNLIKDDDDDAAAAVGGGNVKNPIVIVSRSHTGGGKEYTKKIFGENVNLITAGGSGYKVLQVIFNNATVYIHTTHIKKWDICAGNAILNALGGKMTTLTDEVINYGAGGGGGDGGAGDRTAENQQPNKKNHGDDASDMAGSFVTRNGLLASLTNHKYYIRKILAETSFIGRR